MTENRSSHGIAPGSGRGSGTGTVALSDRRRSAALIVLCSGLLMVILDGTVVTVALPSIQRDLGFSAANLTWVVGAYLVPFGGLLLLAGRLGDLFGRRRVFLSGLLIFTVASALCGLATSPATLILARFGQGVGGAIASSVILGMIVSLFPAERERGRAIGVYSFVGAGGAAIGLLAGGLVTQTLGWHWVFLINVPIGALTAIAAILVVPADRSDPASRRTDVSGAVLITSGLMLAVFTITRTPTQGWGSLSTVAGAVLSTALIGAFVLREWMARDPLLPLAFLRDRRVWGANLTQFLMVGALFGFQFLLGLYLQLVAGFGAAATGLAFLPITVAIGAFSLAIAPRLLVRLGGRSVVVGGLLLIVIGLVLLTKVPVAPSYLTDILPATLVMGAGGGLTLPGLATVGMSAATARDSGLASGLLNTTQQVGGALGLAMLTSVAAARTQLSLQAGSPAAGALTDGYRLAFGIGAALVLGAVIVAVFSLRTAVPRPGIGSLPQSNAHRTGH
jgi:EmrB/QacA subfamily drug resistance transporter